MCRAMRIYAAAYTRKYSRAPILPKTKPRA
jgi:hypothetical protein